MKYNLDCARDILFLLEEKLTISSDLQVDFLTLQDIASYLDKYEINEVAHTLIVLNEADFIEAEILYAGIRRIEELLVSRITYDGYQFIESIRPETVWHKVKCVCAKIGSFSTSAVSQIALSTITSLINVQLGL